VDEICLDGASWRTSDDFYEAYLMAVGAPRWHGRNLDAVWDSLMGADINELNPPFRVRITGLSYMGEDVRSLVRRFAALLEEARSEGRGVEVTLES
jgi:RNAse (barnase) inhibitor barstar